MTNTTTDAPQPMLLIRVQSSATKDPFVHAETHDGTIVVTWRPADGWFCTCDAPEDSSCAHVDETVRKLHPRVTGDEPEPTRRKPTRRVVHLR